ncbi:MAG: transposase [Deltaproteobacteria bacterium]|nr:transposase [Deltaproteobacteria bacterium]
MSNDNPYSEALLKTFKYRPEYPSKPFKNLQAAEQWVREFVSWYNFEHRYSGKGVC